MEINSDDLIPHFFTEKLENVFTQSHHYTVSVLLDRIFLPEKK